MGPSCLHDVRMLPQQGVGDVEVVRAKVWQALGPQQAPNLQKSITDYLQNKIGVNERDRKEISNLLFGDNGVALADDTISHDERMTCLATAVGDICPRA